MLKCLTSHQGLGNITEEGLKDVGDAQWGDCSETLSSGYDMNFSVMNTQRLLLCIQSPRSKTKTNNKDNEMSFLRQDIVIILYYCS